jgi:hypothetical protein
VTRGTVVGWAPQRDTDSARIRWWVTAGSVLPGARRGQAESRPPVTPPHGPGGIETWVTRHGGCTPAQLAILGKVPPHFQGDESRNVPYYSFISSRPYRSGVPEPLFRRRPRRSC